MRKYFNHPPLISKDFVGRARELREIIQFWKAADKNILLLTGIGGIGKTSIVNKFISHLLSNEDLEPDGLFFWDFYDDPDVEHFQNKLHEFVANKQESQYAVGDYWSTIRFLETTGRFLIVLDGLERVQLTTSEEFGYVSSQFDKLIAAIGNGIGNVKCIITSRITLTLKSGNRVQELVIGELTDTDALKLINLVDLNQSLNSQTDILTKYGKHPLTIKLIIAYFSRYLKFPDLDSTSANFQISVSELLDKAFANISVEQKELLNIIALYPEGISIKSIKDVLWYSKQKGIKQENSELQNDELVSILQSLSKIGLITYSEQGHCSIHPLIKKYLETSVNENNDKHAFEFDNIDSSLKKELLDSISLIISGNINHERILFLLGKVKTIQSEDARKLEKILEAALAIEKAFDHSVQSEKERPKAFMSYVRNDTEVVTKLKIDLERNEIDIWIDTEKLLPGVRWRDEIREAIKNGDYFIACISRNYLMKKKSYMNEELTIAIEELRLRPTERLWFIPVLLDPVEIPKRPIGAGETLQDIQHVELFTSWDIGVKKIVKSLVTIS